jgi:hypothetical protein
MANPFAKSRPADKPYAIYRAGDLTWHVLKTYKQVKNEDTYARWMVAAKSDATFGSFDMGDTYAIEVQAVRPACRRRARVAGSVRIQANVPAHARRIPLAGRRRVTHRCAAPTWGGHPVRHAGHVNQKG